MGYHTEDRFAAAEDAQASYKHTTRDPHWSPEQDMSSDAYGNNWIVLWRSDDGIRTDFSKLCDMPEAIATMNTFNAMACGYLERGRYVVRKNR